MGVFKILGGVALGVGAIAAAPFTGGGSILGAATLAGSLAGAGTIAAAGAAGVAGGAIANEIEKERDKKKKAQTDKEERLKKVLAERALREKKLRDNLKAQENKFKEQKTFEEYVIALFAIAISAANSDGEIHPDEMRELEEFISGESYKAIPKSIKTEIERLKNNPPNFNTAMKYVEKVPRIKWSVFDEIIHLTIVADNIIKPEESSFQRAWKKYKYSA